MIENDDLTLGPFYWDGTEILPCTTEATDAAIEQCMGTYQFISNVSNLSDRNITITPRAMTEYIQQDWDRVMNDNPDEGFLLAYFSSQKAVGRLAEQLICAEIFKDSILPQDTVRGVVPIKEAIEQGLLLPVSNGVRCDDLLVRFTTGRIYISEVKASFSGKGYLLRCLPKAVLQLRASFESNSQLHGAFLVLASIKQKFILLISTSRKEIETESPSYLVGMSREMLNANRLISTPTVLVPNR